MGDNAHEHDHDRDKKIAKAFAEYVCRPSVFHEWLRSQNRRPSLHSRLVKRRRG